MEQPHTQAADLSALPRVIASLEEQLAALDQMRLHIAAAHLDAAIQQLRVEQVRDRLKA